MKRLLDSPAGFDPGHAREELYASVLRWLTPDEARILAVLAAGTAFAVIDVVARDRPVLRNASTVGDAAGVTLRDEVPSYLGRLAGFGLVELEGEHAGLGTQYEILATDEAVRAARAETRRSKLVRRTVLISRFGARFWAACDPAPIRAL
jgi:abortive infection alpha-like protein